MPKELKVKTIVIMKLKRLSMKSNSFRSRGPNLIKINKFMKSKRNNNKLKMNDFKTSHNKSRSGSECARMSLVRSKRRRARYLPIDLHCSMKRSNGSKSVNDNYNLISKSPKVKKSKSCANANNGKRRRLVKLNLKTVASPKTKKTSKKRKRNG